ncbi:MAG: hypothetical protein IJQ55_03380 [Alphaproteobacteria bacterium]|nr:hypothetical protein [Alphaproteobacteria bacterium]
MADTTARDNLLVEMFLQYWKYPAKPTFQDDNGDDLADDSVEGLTLTMYETTKNEALMAYPWRSAQKYVFLNNPQTNTTGDGKYKYMFELPEDFLTANGFWLDEQRNQPFQNGVDIIGNIAKTNRSAFMLQYTSNMKDEESKLDPWVIDWIKLYLAANLADIGGLDPATKQFLTQKVQYDEPTLKNKDFEMSHHDETIGNEDKFLGDWY